MNAAPAERLADVAAVQQGLPRVEDVNVGDVKVQVLLEGRILCNDEDAICGG